ncbi:putative amidohydrolase [Caldalkalibacillus uzonensis]|uniref:Amidohydrolase n=1 Tax=Caldalkalibacillus uzonensis TaxID=353224 RepID=A0ABU0CLW2_9BACI|nr:nitrilase-related carbon-nitrogen hydrolase [Caldalkalibacillus uzonensis]MDQ0337406.1 putative amidohydrolase [Caldalkalibacillus uzonensis]
MRLAMAQTQPVLGDVQHNLKHLLQTMEIHQGKADLLIFPELSLTGYMLQEKAYEVALALDATEMRLIKEASRDLNMGVVFGFVEKSDDDILYNSAALVHEGRLMTVHRKVYPVTYGLFEEGKVYGRGRKVTVVPFGNFKATLLICNDLWHPSLVQLCAYRHASLLIGLVNSPQGGLGQRYSSAEGWERVGRFYATIYGCYVVLVNRVGVEKGVSFYGRSLLIDPFGQIVESCPFDQEDYKMVTIDRREVFEARRLLPTMRDEDLLFTRSQLENLSGTQV